MKTVVILVAVALCLASVLAIHELPMEHRKRTPREAKLFVEYMNRGPLMTRVNKLLSKIFPSELTPNIYAYPEVKILNYLDAQYYGYLSTYAERSTSELPLRPSESSSTLDPPTFGFPPRSADSPLLATSTDTSILQRAAPMSITEPTSTLHMVQVQSLDSLVRTLPGSLVLKPRSPSSPKSPSFTESASSPPSSTVFSEWHGLLSQSTVFL